MANTFPKSGLLVNSQDDPMFSWLVRKYPEAASQTFVAGCPVIDTGGTGFIAEASDGPTSGIIGFAVEDGHNSTSAGDDEVSVALAFPNLFIEGNFLGTSAADNVLAATDLFGVFGLYKSADIDGLGNAGWYLRDGGNTAGKILEFKSTYVFPTVATYKPAVGDTNARVRGHLDTGVSVWY